MTELKPCPFQIGDEVTVLFTPEKSWTADWAIPESSWFVSGIRRSALNYDITLAESYNWQNGKFDAELTDGFEPEDLRLVNTRPPIEITEAMVEAGMDALSYSKSDREQVRDIFTAMLAAQEPKP